ncbi:MAG: glycosyltransferase involved in cell wall biosynthesis [Rubritalea sp.]|jgi:glycosyltransferase involved in cell wall biosynthesis
MKIAILAPVPVWFLPGLEHLLAPGHYATWLEPLIPAFEEVVAEHGLDLHWITMSQQTDSDVVHEAYGQTFHILARRSMGRQIITGYITEIRRIRRLLAQLQPDLLHAWGSENVYGIAGAFSGMPVSRKLFTLQGCLTEYVRLLGGNALFRIQAFYEKPLVKRFKHATAESQGAAKLLQALNPKMHIDLVDYGVNQEFFDANWNPAESPELLFLGSCSKRKGLTDLIELARHPELSHIQFNIAGDGELRAQLESTAPPNITFLGKCDRQQVVSCLESAWALIVPTYSDTGPTVIKEARVVGLPIITTTGAGASSYITETGCGYVTKPGDIEALSSALLDTCSSRENAMRLGSLSHGVHRETLHPNSTARKFAEIYHAQHAQ